MDTERLPLASRRGGGMGGQQVRLRRRTLLALRLASGGLLIAAGAIHLYLYLTGYRSMPRIGGLFLAQAVAAAGHRVGSRGRGHPREAVHDHAFGRISPGHLRGAPAVYVHRRHRPGASQRPRAKPERRTLARGNCLRVAACAHRGGAVGYQRIISELQLAV
jgi:hypothetical protein